MIFDSLAPSSIHPFIIHPFMHPFPRTIVRSFVGWQAALPVAHSLTHSLTLSSQLSALIVNPFNDVDIQSTRISKTFPSSQYSYLEIHLRTIISHQYYLYTGITTIFPIKGTFVNCSCIQNISVCGNYTCTIPYPIRVYVFPIKGMLLYRSISCKVILIREIVVK